MTAGFAFPKALEPYRHLKCWVNWKLKAKGNGKFTKLPYRPSDPGKCADASDPATWGSFDEAFANVERGVADGYGWPITGIFDLGWDKVTKFRMEPPFYSVEVNVVVNLDAWKSLNNAQRNLLNGSALWLEGLDDEKEADIKAERERQAAAGIRTLDFGAAASKAFLDRAYEVAWQSVIKRAPENGPKLRQLAGN